MRVFKIYFKLLKKSLPTLLIYIGIFLLITIMFSLSIKDSVDNVFEGSKVRTALINNDKDSYLLQELKSHLANSSEFIVIDESVEGMQDALFFREVSYILVIPKGFTESFLHGKELSLKKYTVPDSAINHNVDIAINNFLNTAKVYRNNIQNITEETLISKTIQDLDAQVNVSIHSDERKNINRKFQVVYYNYLVYAILSVLILGISSIMISFSNLDLRRRNYTSPLSLYSIQFQQILGHIVFALICVVLFVLTGNILDGQLLFDKISMLFILNTLIFTFPALSIAYLVGSLTKSREITNGIANVIGLGMSFLSGVFVPMEFLGEAAIQLAKFTPAYWYTTANVIIGNLSHFTWEQLSPIYGHMLIQLGFAFAIFAMSLVVNKKKSTETA